MKMGATERGLFWEDETYRNLKHWKTRSKGEPGDVTWSEKTRKPQPNRSKSEAWSSDVQNQWAPKFAAVPLPNFPRLSVEKLRVGVPNLGVHCSFAQQSRDSPGPPPPQTAMWPEIEKEKGCLLISWRALQVVGF